MIDSLFEIGVGGGVAILLVKEVLSFIKAQRANGENSCVTEKLCRERHGNVERRIDGLTDVIGKLDEKIDRVLEKLYG